MNFNLFSLSFTLDKSVPERRKTLTPWPPNDQVQQLGPHYLKYMSTDEGKSFVWVS